MNMTTLQAQQFTTEVIGLLLKHQENLLGLNPLATEGEAKQAAKNLVAFRRTLMEELQQR